MDERTRQALINDAEANMKSAGPEALGVLRAEDMLREAKENWRAYQNMANRPADWPKE